MSATKIKSSFARHSSRQGSRNSYNLREPTESTESRTSLLHPLLLSPKAPNRLLKSLEDVWLLLGSNYINGLLLITPFALLAGPLSWHPIATFVLNSLVIISLQNLVTYASEELCLSMGQVSAGLFNAMVGNNAIDLILSIVGLIQNEVRIVESYIMGTILLNTLLIPGACFFFGGLNHREQRFGGSVISTLLFPTLASVMILVMPTALYSVTNVSSDNIHEFKSLSLGCAVVLLLLHAGSLIFQLKTHADSFDDDVDTMEEDSESVEPQISVWIAALSLPLTLVLVAFCAQNVIRSLSPIIENSGLSRAVAGFVLLPFLSYTTELLTAAVVAHKNKPVLALGVCTGGIMLTVLFVMPVLVIIGAAINHPLTLYFGSHEIIAVFFAALLLAALLQKGSSNYLDGLLCLGFYAIVVIAFCILPEDGIPSERGIGTVS